jgi:hypothetical protein
MRIHRVRQYAPPGRAGPALGICHRKTGRVDGYRRTRCITLHEIATDVLPEKPAQLEARNQGPMFDTPVAAPPEAQREVLTMLKVGAPGSRLRRNTNVNGRPLRHLGAWSGTKFVQMPCQKTARQTGANLANSAQRRKRRIGSTEIPQPERKLPNETHEEVADRYRSFGRPAEWHHRSPQRSSPRQRTSHPEYEEF